MKLLISVRDAAKAGFLQGFTWALSAVFFFLGGGGPQAVLLLKCEEKLECCFSS
jgi:hypothetical protein